MDLLGRDVFSRVIYSSRIAFYVGIWFLFSSYVRTLLFNGSAGSEMVLEGLLLGRELARAQERRPPLVLLPCRRGQHERGL